MHPAEARLKRLIALKEAEEISETRSQNYIDDLNILIKSCQESLKHINKDGFRMVGEG